MMPMMPMPMPMVPPFGAYPTDASLAATKGEGNARLVDTNAELMRQNMELKAQIDYMTACNAMSEASWKKQEKRKQGRSVSNATTATFFSEAMILSDGDDTPKSRVSRTSRRSKSGKQNYGDDM